MQSKIVLQKLQKLAKTFTNIWHCSQLSHVLEWLLRHIWLIHDVTITPPHDLYDVHASTKIIIMMPHPFSCTEYFAEVLHDFASLQKFLQTFASCLHHFILHVWTASNTVYIQMSV